MTNTAIRPATLVDAVQIAQLVTDLGYPTARSQMRRRLETILADNDYSTLVASAGQRIVGFIGTRVGPLYESDGLYGQVMALAVAPDRHRQGIGTSLMQAAEKILAERGALVSIVHSGNHRADAHAFYEKSGYAFTARRYKKLVTSGA